MGLLLLPLTAVALRFLGLRRLQAMLARPALPANGHEVSRSSPSDSNLPNPPLRKGGTGDFHGKGESNAAEFTKAAIWLEFWK